VKIKLTISLDPELGDAVREAAAEAGMTLSEWLGRAAETKLKQDTDAKILEEAARKRRTEALKAYLDEWQAEHGAFTDEELAETAQEMGLDWPPTGGNE
jgi:TRAP-type C4-dicarboxylate transport system substrate-binding protein